MCYLFSEGMGQWIPSSLNFLARGSIFLQASIGLFLPEYLAPTVAHERLKGLHHQLP
jgi:hypothetical protein